METFWKIKEVAALVQVSVGTIYRYVFSVGLSEAIGVIWFTIMTLWV